ncbi:hypothetical protein [Anaeromyxobacter oryzae]|uniref:Lipoprotein n=1 Tax=Anaeromyxobacter oryzae TaxID=2918170 RepID=A0ABN6N062_9BACT|nr:hypothetical protein [Anaeromyxobacter oryzae]BDG05920.1 hypothetical protein AMOR_49160 [Anaeromyxobacter oryzae]
MVLLPLLLVAAAAGPEGPALDAQSPPENLLRGPARCVLHYLDAVRLAGPRAPDVRPDRAVPARERDYEAARRLTAPRALDEIARRAARGEGHPLAPWQQAARGGILESFQLLAVRRAPRGTAVVTVRESTWVPAGDGALARSVSEYLVARVEGAWRVVDRRTDAAFEDADVAAGYAGWFDDPAAPGLRPATAARDAPLPSRATSRRPADPR